MKHASSSQGFTIVEMAIVVIVVGLLVGGILKGNEIIINSRVNKTVSQLGDVKAALQLFKQNYRFPPGDLRSPATTLPNCNQHPCNRVGNADGIIGTTAIEDVSDQDMSRENTAAWAQFAAAGMIKGVKTNATVRRVGESHPAVAMDGSLNIMYKTPTDSNFLNVIPQTPVQHGHYVVILSRTDAENGNYDVNTNMPAIYNENLDRKMDDGMPNTGAVIGGGRRGAANDPLGAPCAAGTLNSDLYHRGTSFRCRPIVRLETL